MWRPLERSRPRWEDNIKMDIHGVEWEGWTGLMWQRIATYDRLL